jgi:hypothetical protein
MENSAGLNLLNSPSATIINNNIQNNNEYNVYFYDTPNNINVTNNWWGTTNT